MSLLDVMRAAVAGGAVNQEFAQTMQQMGNVAQMVGQYSNPYARALFLQVLLPWASQIARNAPSRWMLPAGAPTRCAFEPTCDQQAIACCHLCGRPVCLGHALVSGDALVVCWSCMKVAAANVKRWQPAKGAASGQQAPPPDLRLAYKLLGVEDSCTDAQLKTAHKRFVAKYHPDKGQGAEDIAQRGALLKAVQDAYTAIRKSREGKTQ